MASRKFQAPKGTRDFYPEEMLRRRYITEAWRAVSLRHGFEEIDGPTFEHLDLYTVKSGEEIVSQLFSFRREGGGDTYALRPEFTPTLARMYAARANTLPKPVRWFSVLPYFRAERPQRGRLREFLQWNCDVIGSDSSSADADLIACTADSLASFGLSSRDASIAVNHRSAVEFFIDAESREPEEVDHILTVLDRATKLPSELVEQKIGDCNLHPIHKDLWVKWLTQRREPNRYSNPHFLDQFGDERQWVEDIHTNLTPRAVIEWCLHDTTVIRGLAYYTGTVFEVIAGGERAVAGGGRYDNLIELLGGPPTPAVGFAMGDVVLGNLLDDKGMMPSEGELPEAVESMVRSQRVRPEVFVVSGGEEGDERVVPLVARLRRGVEREGWSSDAKPWQTERRYAVRPLHARATDKSTRTLKKLLADAERQRARFAAVVDGPERVRLKDLDAREDVPGDFSASPESDRYVGRAVAGRLEERAARARSPG